MRVSRRCFGGSPADVFLILILVVLLLVFTSKLSTVPPLPPHPTQPRVDASLNVQADEPDVDVVDLQGYIDPRVKMMKDLRSSECKSGGSAVMDKVTVVLHFNDYELHDLKLTISAILQNTPTQMLREILIIDDGSLLDHIKTESMAYFKDVPKCRLIVNDKRRGMAKARMLGLHMAVTEIVVFADKSVLVGLGWLEPLIQVLHNHPDCIVTPHFDQIADSVSYNLIATSDNLITTFSWSLTMRVTETTSGVTSDGLYRTPALRGNIFAVRKTFFKATGGYDQEFRGDGGAHLELSLRTWMCGGAIYVAPCSRVGIINLLDPIAVTSKYNLHRISELWFGERKENVYRASLEKISDVDRHSWEPVSAARSHSTCKDINWYLKDVMQGLATPSSIYTHFGLLRVKSDRCGRLAADGHVDLDVCRPDRYSVHPDNMMFEYDNDRRIRVSGKCLTTTSLRFLVGEECRPGDLSQQFDFTDAHTLMNMDRKWCAMHATDPITKTRQLAMMQDCSLVSQTSNFMTWQFVSL